MNQPIDDAIKQLSEHYDCIVVLASSYENGTTSWSYRAYGNHMTRQGMANHYLSQFEEDTQPQNREVDGGEDWRTSV